MRAALRCTISRLRMLTSESAPNNTDIYQGLATKLLSPPWAPLKGPLKDCSGAVGLFGCSVNVLVPALVVL